MEFWARPNAARADTPEENYGITGIASQRYAIFPYHPPTGTPFAGAGVSVGTNGVSVFEHADNYLPSLLVYDTPITGWTHIAVVYVNRQPSLYINGVLVRTGVTSTTHSCPGTCLGEAGTGYGYYSGLLDEVSIYNRPLSAAEIQTIYSAGSAGKCASLPIIVSQPQGQTVFAGSTVNLSAAAVGSQPLGYQWVVNGSNILAMATNATLTLTNVQPANAGNYSMFVSNLVGSANSSNAALTVIPSGSCFPPPLGLVSWWAAEGNALDSFGTNNGRLVNGVGFAPGEVGQAFSFNGTSQYVSNVSPRLSNIVDSYTVEFWAKPNAARADTPEENDGITGISSQRYAVCPSLDVQSDMAGSGVSVGTNGISVFEHAGGYLPSLLVYDAPITGWTHIAVVYTSRQPSLYVNGILVRTGVTSARSSCPSTSLGENDYNYGYYSGLLDEVSIYNRSLSAAEIQTIYSAGSAGKCQPETPPIITSQPAGQAAGLGATATFSVGAFGAMPFGYQWQFNHSNILAAANATATNATLVLNNVQPANAGNYSVLVSNPFGSTNSSNAVLTFLFPPTITLEPVSQLVRPGCTVTFISGATGSGTLLYQWQLNGSNLPAQNNTSLTLVNIQMTNFGNYTMIASNAYGAATSTVAVLALDHLPVPGNIVLQRFPGAGVRMNTGDILAGATDADGDPLSLGGIAAVSAAGGTVTLNGPSIYYYPPPGLTNTDSFNYTISDGHCGGIAVGAVHVEVRSDLNPASRVTIFQLGNGSVQVIFDGMPGVAYRVQTTDSLTSPNWQDVTTLTAGQYGTYIYVDSPATNGPVRYFRSVSP